MACGMRMSAASTFRSHHRPTCVVQVFGCIFDDLHGLRSRDEVGLEHILFESDYPHANGTWPDSRRRAWELSSKAGLDGPEVYQLVRGNAINVYGLERFGITE